VLRLVPVREGDVGEVDVEGRAGLEHLVRALERGGERLDVRERAVAGRVHVREIEHRADPAEPPRDLEHVIDAADLAYAAHHFDSEWDGAVLGLEPLAQLGELLANRLDRRGSGAAEQEAGVEDDRLGARGLRDPGRVVEHPDRHVQLLAALGVAHEARDRRVDGKRDLALLGEPAELGRPLVVHPELAFEVDLAGVEPTFLKQRDGRRRAFARGDAGRAEADTSHVGAS